MIKEQLTMIEVDLSTQEKRVFKKRLFTTLLASILLGCIIFFLFHFIFNMEFGTVGYIFESFFFLILIFIVGSATKTALQGKKKIYSGIVTTKNIDANRSLGKQSDIKHFIYLDEVPFRVSMKFYEQCHKGERIELHVVGKNEVIQLTSKESKPEPIENRHQTKFKKYLAATSTSLEFMNDEQHQLIRSQFFKTLIWRIMLAFGPLYILLSLLFVILVVFFNQDLPLILTIRNYFWLILALLIYLLNRKTIRLYRDYSSREMLGIREKIVDFEKSNVLRRSRHSISTRRGHDYYNSVFYYIRTENYWIQVEEEAYKQLKRGEIITVKIGRYSKAVLGFSLN